MANSDTNESYDNAGCVGQNEGSINTDKDETKQQEGSKMKTDEINLTVDNEDESESERRCGLLQDRVRLQAKLHSHKFQMIIIALVALDFLIVLVQLLMDIQVIKGVDHHHVGLQVLHYTSIVILGLFLVEIVVKLYAFGLDFFHHKLEVFDAIVVIVSFALDISYSGNMDAWDAVGLLVLLRLWRIVRIVNGIVLSVKIEMEEKMHHLKEEITELQTQLDHYKNRCKEQEAKITELEVSKT